MLSGYRSPALNKAVGGTNTSAHSLGYAVDFTVSGSRPLEVARKIVASSIKFDQLIHEVSRNIVHISFDPRYRMQILTQPGGAGTQMFVGLGDDKTPRI